MSDPWDPFITLDGDENASTLYTAVGAAMSSWSDFEASLGALYCSFISVTGDVRPALRAFGSIISFEAKLTMLRASCREFHRNLLDKSICDKLDKKFKKDYRNWAARRNELAHGAVRFRINLETGIGKHYLLPTWFDFPKHAVDGWKPLYQYNSTDILKFSETFRVLQEEALMLTQESVDLHFLLLKKPPD